MVLFTDGVLTQDFGGGGAFGGNGGLVGNGGIGQRFNTGLGGNGGIGGVGGNPGGVAIGTTFPDNTIDNTNTFVDATPPDGLDQGRQGFCYLPRLPGNCRGRFLSYYYDAITRRCRAFFYSGCQGNENRFPSRQECQQICGNGGIVGDVCTLPPVTGPCRASMRRFFYNSALGQCEPFRYGGCQGNRNNFQTFQACQQRCGGGGGGGGGGDGGVFPPGSPCLLQHAQSGNCLGFFPSWTYNSNTGRCQEFVYGGCGGNRNRFNTLMECRRVCDRNDGGGFVPGMCRLPGDSGPCRAFIPRWSWSMANGQCERFIYGGCAGNGNNFITRQQCEDTCGNAGGGGGVVNRVCILPEVTGPCRASIPRWHFNQATRRCERFIYGGCQGNENNFNTWGQCQRVCGQRAG
ncbi:actinia tenebrosa protease inhibitors-like [Saccostrea echinata]|uniref:actinia tenebrosa protease inhibitors-like n=1 Tax=Saccostrea echinata TaxID=191078 RepID=UPI002A82B6EC|nr:actinia tenebrosa protease inhibitors-like [Saccostrea echinata]